MRKLRLRCLSSFTIILFLVFAQTLLSDSAQGNFMIGVKPSYAKVSIEYPQNSFYNETEIPLSFTILTNRFTQSRSNYSDNHCFIVLDSRTFELGGLSRVGQKTVTNDSNYSPYTELTVTGNTSIANLSSGIHSVQVKYGFYYAWPNDSYRIDFIVLSSATTEFTVDNGVNGSEATITGPSPAPYAYSTSNSIANKSTNPNLTSPSNFNTYSFNSRVSLMDNSAAARYNGGISWFAILPQKTQTQLSQQTLTKNLLRQKVLRG